MPTRTWVALLRAVNVTGTGKLLMQDLRRLCEEAGCAEVRTYIQSGNVVFSSGKAAGTLKATLERALHATVGRPTQVVLRSADDLARTLEVNPFPEAEPSRLMVLFLDAAPPRAEAERLGAWPVPGEERLELIERELFIHFPDGQGRSRLRIPFADRGTGRNLNTVRALLAMARGGS